MVYLLLLSLGNPNAWVLPFDASNSCGVADLTLKFKALFSCPLLFLRRLVLFDPR